MRRKPQCTTSWSSTTSTHRRRPSPPSTSPGVDKEPHLPSVGPTGPELDDPAELECFARGQPQPHAPGRRALGLDAVVDDLEPEAAVRVVHADVQAGGLGMPEGVAHRLVEYR